MEVQTICRFNSPPSVKPQVSHPLKHPDSCLHTYAHSLSHSPSDVWLSMPLSVWLRMSLTSSPVLPPPTLLHTHTHRQSHPCFPSVTLHSADSSVACQKCWSLIATVRWDGLCSIEFRMTPVSYDAGVGSDSCLGTVLLLKGPATWKIPSWIVNS